MPQPIRLEPFTVAPQTYAREAMERLVARWWWVGVAPALVCFGVGVGDWRWLVVGFALLLVVAPMVLAFAWITLLGAPGRGRAVAETEGELSPEEGVLRIGRDSIALTQVKRCDVWHRSYLRLWLEGERHPVLIPASAIPDSEKQAEFYSLLLRDAQQLRINR